jgi:hypothetical protein
VALGISIIPLRAHEPALWRCWRLLSANQLIDSLSALPAARRLAASQPISSSVQVGGIEVATAVARDDAAIRRIWRERQKGGATPLILVTDTATHGVLSVLGPADGDGALRQVEGGPLEELLRRISILPRLDAVREVAAELERLDQSGIPGLRLRDLLTLHTLDRRLRNDGTRWSAANAEANKISGATEWRSMLTALGYEIERRPQRGYLLRVAGRPVAVVHPMKDAAAFSKFDDDGRPPEGALLADCDTEGTKYGLLAAGLRLRLFDFATPGAATARYIDLDPSVMRPGDRPFIALVSPEYLAEGEFARLVEDARQFGIALRKRLDDNLRQSALPALARAIHEWAASQKIDLKSEAQLVEIEKAALTLLFRLLFLLYAESSRYLPVDNRVYSNASVSTLAAEAEETREKLSPRSTTLWDRLHVLVGAMRTGNDAWRVPPYNGALFAADGFEGAALLERMSLTDPAFADLLIAVGREDARGIDYSSLEIGHLGNIYEALLSLRLTTTTRPLVYDAGADRYRPPIKGEKPTVADGELLWTTNEGGRKAGGVYYTPTELVRHLVKQAVMPAFERHLAEVEAMAERDPAGAARHLLDFAVVDPACGSAHFLVEVVGSLADRTVRFLGEHPLPALAESIARLRTGALPGTATDDSMLIRRLMLKHCVYGVDISPMGAEVAKLSLWLASFVPGLSLAYLDGNLKVGDSLVGVVRSESVGSGKHVPADWQRKLGEVASAALAAADIDDRNPDEVKASEVADAKVHAAAETIVSIFNLWTAEPFGVAGARQEVLAYAQELLDGSRVPKIQGKADSAAREHGFLHWAAQFSRVFARDRPGFDAVVGNPPWNELTIEELGFYALYAPGLKGMSDASRTEALAKLLEDRPELPERLKATQAAVAEQRRYLAAGEYERMAGDPDLYKYFCQRYRALLRDGGELGVVLPRSTFLTKGSTGFREWLFGKTTCHRIDFLLNNRLWMFDTHPQYTVALVAAGMEAPPPDHRVRIAGVASSLAAWNVQSASGGVAVPLSAFATGLIVPLVRNEREAELLARLRTGDSFPLGSGGRWRCFPVAELHETHDAKYWRGVTKGRPLWKGESFDQYAPIGIGERAVRESAELVRTIQKPRPGADSMIAEQTSLGERRAAVVRELARARVAFRDVTNRTNSRTVLACLIPAGVLLTNKAPYLTFVPGNELEQAVCLGIMNSLPFDWQARRFVETNVNFFILEALSVPGLNSEDFLAIARASATLSCPDARFTDFATAFDLRPRELDPVERDNRRADIDARVARAWDLSAQDLQLMFTDFTADAVSPDYRRLVLQRFGEL